MKAKPATPAARTLRLKLEALAKQGVNGEATAAQAKLARLLARYDWNAPAQDLRDLFKGVFQTSTEAQPVARLDSGALDVASFVKWAIEQRCKVPCLFKDGQLFAQATRKTAQRLASIATAVSDSFLKLWTQYRATPGVNPADRANFLLGLYEGMMDEARQNEALPRRAGVEHWRPTKAKRKAVAHAAGISLHPYSVAVDLGRQIRFCVPLEEVKNQLQKEVKNQLQKTIRGAIPDNSKTT